MDRAMLERRLAQAEKHIAIGRRNAAAQRMLVDELRRDQHPTEMAERVLALYEELLALHEEDAARLRKELEQPFRGGAVREQHLAQAERHVAIARRNTASQRMLVDELRRDRHPVKMAVQILAAYEDVLALHEADAARLRKEAELSAASPLRALGKSH
jgi:hypothetical protein